MQGLSDRMAQALKLVGPDYDYGAGGAYDKKSGHWGDAGKLPNHPTYSNQSVYSAPGVEGGKWSTFVDGDGKLQQMYTPSIDMVNSGTTKGLGKYMQRVEPNVILGTPNKGL